MKKAKDSKVLKLKQSHIKHGVKLSGALDIGEVPLRKFKIDVMNEVKYGRKAFVVTDYKKRFALLLPLAEGDD